VGLEQLILQMLKTRGGRAVVAALLTISGGFFVWIMLPAAKTAMELANKHESAVGEVIDSRVSHGLHLDTTYDLRYRFHAPGVNKWFYETDHTGRPELWASLPKDEWDEAVKSGSIQVIYDPDDPNNNDLSRNLARLRSTAIWSSVFSVLWCGAGVVWLAAIIAKALMGQQRASVSTVQRVSL
jgi:hypothetical protein